MRDCAARDARNERMGLRTGNAEHPAERAPDDGAYHRGHERHERLMGMAREIDHVEHREGAYVVHLERPVVAEVSQRKRLNAQDPERFLYLLMPVRI